MKTTAIVQARMSSKRLPGKSLYRVGGKSLIQYLIERLQRCLCLNRIIIATSQDSSDVPIVDFCLEQGIACYRGDLGNVMKRFVDVVIENKLPHFARVNADSPLMDPSLIDRGMALFSSHGYDLVTNIFPRSYPPGESVEIMSASALHDAYALATEPEDFEHVTKVFYKYFKQFKICNFKADLPYEGVQLAIDTPDDLETFKCIVSKMERPPASYTLDEIVSLYRDVRKIPVL